MGESVFGFGQTARLIGFSATSWWIGRYLDRHGARLPLVIAGLVAGASVIGLAAITDGWQLIFLLFVSGLTGLYMAGGTLYATVPISAWFVKNRGKALSITFLGLPIGIFITPPLTQFLIDEIGWRQAWLVLGITGTAIIMVAAAIVRRRPEDMGLLPDGGAVREPGETGKPSHVIAEVSWTREEAMKSSAFWRLASVDGLRMGAMGTVGIYRVSYFIDQGVDAQIVAFALSFEAVMAALISVPTGWAVDRVPPRFLAAASTMAMVVTLGAIIQADSVAGVFLASGLFGVAAASFDVSRAATWPNYFGAANIGKIRGIAMPIGLSLSAISAPLTGIIKDETGEFLLAWIAAAVALAAASAILLFTPKPKAPVREPAAGLSPQ